MGRFLRDSAKGTFNYMRTLILFLEVILRFAAFAWHHYSEYYLFYGIHTWVGRVGINPWSTIDGSYYKFPPNYVLKGQMARLRRRLQINSLGFRGPILRPPNLKECFESYALGSHPRSGILMR